MSSTILEKALAGALLLAAPLAAWAQEHGQPSTEDIKKKVLEVERLMKAAESALASTTDTRSATERSADAARKILDERARRETGKSAEELRKLAEGDSDEAKKAAESLARLTQAAEEEAKKAAEKITDLGQGTAGGASKKVKELIEEIRGEGKSASSGIQWLIDNAIKDSGGGGGQKPPPPPQQQPGNEQPKDPKKPEKDPKEPQDGTKKPDDKTEPPPKPPEFDQWLVSLPPQVRKAYMSEDWDSIPPKWRDMLKKWIKQMAEKESSGGKKEDGR
jgi:hypothetical protein